MPTFLRHIATGYEVIACERCGTSFTCALGGPCWCGQEEFRLPLTTEGGPTDFLCPSCLRDYAGELRAKGLNT